MIAKARSISHGSISIDYITRLGMAEIVKLNHIPKDVEVEAWWAHMQAHQMKFQYKRSKHRPMKNFMIRIEISPAREETEGFTLADWKKLAEDFIKAFDAIDLSKRLAAPPLLVLTSPTPNTLSLSIVTVSRASSTCILIVIALT